MSKQHEDLCVPEEDANLFAGVRQHGLQIMAVLLSCTGLHARKVLELCSARTVLLCGLVVALQGCASQDDFKDDGIEYQQASIMQQPQVNNNGAIFNASNEIRFFEDIKARHVGDILTVMLVENTSGSKSADTNLSQATAVGVNAPTFGGTLRTDVGVSMDSANNFTGESGSSQSNSLNGSIAVTITSVMPNGNLMVQGEKWIEINQGKEYIRLHGVVRPRDVRPNNTIYSTQVADARISYSGTGATENANVVGWAARVVFSTLFPF